MKKYYKFISFLILYFTLTGCNSSKRIAPPPFPTFEGYITEEECSEQDLLQIIKPSKDNTIRMQDSVQDSLHTSDRTYTIEGKKYKLNGHKGKFNVSYPVLKSDQKDMTVVNSVILARVVDELYYEDAATTIDIDLDYEVECANDAFISILFTGFYNAYHAAHPNNVSFTINFDLTKNRPLSLYDVVFLDDNILEKVHGAMISQLEPEVLAGFELLSVNESYEQIYDKYEGFYVEDGKLYIRFTIPAGAQYHEYISFTISE